MSRIGKKPIPIPTGVTVTPAEGALKVKGPKGELTLKLHPHVKISVKGGVVEVLNAAHDPALEGRAIHGTTRSLIANMVKGVSAGFQRKLEIQGVGYQAKIQGDEIHLLVGFSQPVKVKLPSGVKVECPQPTTILVSGPDKQAVGHLAASLRKVRPPEPYKGKGIRFEGEIVKRKAGKAFGSAGAAAG
jgi:large subunit ribosomal protein L6